MLYVFQDSMTRHDLSVEWTPDILILCRYYTTRNPVFDLGEGECLMLKDVL